MAVKMTGKQFKEFYSDPAVWGDDDSDTYCDGSVIERKGVEDEDFNPDDIADDEVIKVVCGDMCNGQKGVPASFDGAARWWLKRQSIVSFVVECHKDEESLLRDVIKAHGGKVL